MHVVVDSLFIVAPFFVGDLCLVLVLLFGTWCLFSFAIILMEKRELVLLYLSSCCLVTVRVLWPFLAVPLVGVKCVIVVIPGYIYLLFSDLDPNI